MLSRLLILLIAMATFVSCNFTSGKNAEGESGDIQTCADADVVPYDDYQFLVRVGDEAPDFEMELFNEMVETIDSML